MTLRLSAPLFSGPLFSGPLSALAGAALLAASVLPAAADGGVKLEYEVWAGGVRVLEAEIVMRTTGDRYRLDLEAELVGPPSWVEEYNLVVFSEGTLGGAGPQPEIFRQEERHDDDEPRWVQLAYSGSLPLVDANTNLEKKRREPVTDAQKQGSIDPLTGLLSLVLQAAARGSCEGSAAVFDGRRRFDVSLTDAGTGEMAKSRLNAYEGPTQRCEVSLTPIAGYRYSGHDKAQFPESVVLQGAELVPGLPPLPVRLDTEIEYGALILHLVDYEAVEPTLE
jgi:hypothetical protein